MEKNFENKPKNFVICYNSNCLLGDKCLRRAVSFEKNEEFSVMPAINAMKFNENNCEYFLENKRVKIAYGMTKSFEDVKAKDIAQIRKRLIQYFGQTYYYERRKGNMPISPEEQEFIAELFKSYGYEITFDEIREETLWK
jgi:hypothetical protein